MFAIKKLKLFRVSKDFLSQKNFSPEILSDKPDPARGSRTLTTFTPILDSNLI